MPVHSESLRDILASFQVERARTMDPAALRANVEQRRQLVETSNPAAYVQRGDRVEPFALIDVEGSELSLDALVADGPVVLVFFRFAGCPACNIALPYYDRALRPGLAERGVRLVAVSPQVPERLREIQEKHNLAFTVASDPGNALGRRFGILFEPDSAAREAALAQGRFIGDITGTGTWELPMPAVVLIGTDKIVRFADVTPDWLARTEASEILDAVDTASGRAAAA